MSNIKFHLSLSFIFIFSLSIHAQFSNDGLIAYYPFDGNVSDASVNNYDGNLIGGSFGDDEAGNPNSALFLNGIGDFVDLSAFASAYRENLSEITIYFKVKFEKTENNQTILSLGNHGENIPTNVFEIEYENNRLQIESETGSNAINHELEVDQGSSFFDNKWHEVLISIKGDSLIYCRDDEEIYNGIYIPSESNSDNLFLGCFGGTGSEPCCFFGGYIDDLQFYNRILDKEELSVSNNEITLDEPIRYYPNPTQGNLRVELGKSYHSFKIRVINIEGKSLMEKDFENTSEFDINLPFPPGTYFLQIYNKDFSDEFQTLRIIKQ